MAQHLPIQAKRHCQLKQHTQKQRATAFLPGSAHMPLGETVPDCLAVFTHRQAPTSPRPTVFSLPPGGAHHATRRQTIQGPLALVSPPGAPTRAARRCISSRTPLVF
ncbi:hypothetical protein DEO72_LG8g1157 [Vigna unguiculata]|uniref:Uncharacterized protein n=1 Tax=Vigna unguiculata TaxID=3917 RepID=A0A4D6MNY6_VIGUN|nr:hypothetical protein DEO72_LG8g1157 [Vigna unguiculata]